MPAEAAMGALRAADGAAGGAAAGGADRGAGGAGVSHISQTAINETLSANVHTTQVHLPRDTAAAVAVAVAASSEPVAAKEGC
jgi:hypothetical protein